MKRKLTLAVTILLTICTLFSLFMVSANAVTREEAKAWAKYIAEKRSHEYVTFPEVTYDKSNKNALGSWKPWAWQSDKSEWDTRWMRAIGYSEDNTCPFYLGTYGSAEMQETGLYVKREIELAELVLRFDKWDIATPYPYPTESDIEDLEWGNANGYGYGETAQDLIELAEQAATIVRGDNWLIFACNDNWNWAYTWISTEGDGEYGPGFNAEAAAGKMEQDPDDEYTFHYLPDFFEYHYEGDLNEISSRLGFRSGNTGFDMYYYTPIHKGYTTYWEGCPVLHMQSCILNSAWCDIQITVVKAVDRNGNDIFQPGESRVIRYRLYNDETDLSSAKCSESWQAQGYAGIDGIDNIGKDNRNTYTVTFVDVCHDERDIFTVKEGDTVTPPDASITKYDNQKEIFLGWFDRETGKKFDPKKGITKNMVIDAHFGYQYEVEFDEDGGSNIKDQWIDEGGKAKKPSNPTKEGYTFKEWQFNGRTYDFSAPVTSNITLKAVWEKQKVTVKFDSNGGSSVASVTIDYTDKVSKPADPTRAGYEFLYWTFNGKAYDFDSKVQSDITLKAEWKEQETISTVKFDVRLNSASATSFEVAVVDGKIEKPADPAQEGYTFLYWATEDGKEFDFEKGEIKEGLQLTAVWNKNGDDKPITEDPSQDDTTKTPDETTQTPDESATTPDETAPMPEDTTKTEKTTPDGEQTTNDGKTETSASSADTETKTPETQKETEPEKDNKKAPSSAMTAVLICVIAAAVTAVAALVTVIIKKNKK